MAKTEDLRSIPESDIITVLAEDIDFKGSIHFKSSLMIKGNFEGEINSEGLLIIGAQAKLNAQIKTNTLVSNGDVTGNIQATSSAVLTSSAVHTGDIQTPNLIIESGALLNGNTIMHSKKKSIPHSETNPHSHNAASKNTTEQQKDHLKDSNKTNQKI